MSDKSTPQELIIKRVTSQELCKLFNDGGYLEMVKSGKLTEHVLEHCQSTLLTQETVSIESQMVSYRDADNNEVARVHQFMRPDGTRAASGKPDPKRLLKDGILYRLEKKPKTNP